MTVLLVATWIALAATCIALVTSGAAVRSPRHRTWARRSLLAAWIAVTVPLGLLVADFLLGRLDIFYVWQNIEQSYPWWLRLAGLWGGQAGTFLLWAWFLLSATVVEGRIGASSNWPSARVVLLAIAVVLLVPTVVLGLGSQTTAYGLSVDGKLVRGLSGPGPLTLRPAGQGLNPLLESPYMAIHPLVEFLAYGLTAVPFAYGLTHLFRGGPWQDRARAWARPAWLAFLAALTLGALWAYTVLSFGGYWIWDPVEVGNLLPFIALTLFLHATAASRQGNMGLLAPSSAVLAFTLIIFADFVVRSGLWSSVHAFLPTGLSIAIEDPGRRLLVAVEESFQARYATTMATAAIATTSAGASAFHARRLPRRSRARALAWTGIGLYALVALGGLLAPATTVAILHRVMLLIGLGRPLVGAVGLVLLALVPWLLGLAAMPADVPTSLKRRPGQLVLACALLVVTLAATTILLVLGVNGYDESVFEARAPYLAAPILALVGLTFHHGRFRRWAIAIAAGMGLGVALKLVTGSWAWAALPVALVPAAGAAWLYACRARPTASLRHRIQALMLLVAGVLGAVQWASPGSVVVGSMALASPAWYLPVGLVASAVAILAPFLETRRGCPAWLGPVAAVLAIGYGASAALGLAALWLGPTRAHGPRGRPASTAIPLLHVGLAVLVLGVALSTFGTSLTAFDQADPLVRGEPRSVQAGTVELVDGHVEDRDGDDRPDAVSATVHVRQDGVFVAEETLTLEHHLGTGFTSRGSFVPDASPVTRSWWGDIAHNADTRTPLAIRLTGGNETWITANGPPPRSFPQQVDAVSMGVKTLPGTNLLWAGTVILALGMGVRIAGGTRRA